ncbi:uncharacterized protein LOC127857258 [Dreissena polymorpha]|uniref:uncharacterized protein LOC127857258 n=1 Tax=Dreissena polymorpha TaxID=45954 RepID=UPI002263CB2B|nr:uncharacterized protein LOC127857258 [Dreissena polymorpha]
MGNSGTVAPLIEEFRHSGSPEWEIQAQWQPCLGNSGTVAVLIGEFSYHIPRILSVCILMFGISGLLTSLPNFLTSNGNVATPRNGSVAQAQNRLCLLERHDNTTFTEKCALESASEMSRDRDSQWVVIFISCMMLIQGVAKAPRSALSSLYN